MCRTHSNALKSANQLRYGMSQESFKLSIGLSQIGRYSRFSKMAERITHVTFHEYTRRKDRIYDVPDEVGNPPDLLWVLLLFPALMRSSARYRA